MQREANRTGTTFIVDFNRSGFNYIWRSSYNSFMSEAPDFETSLRKLEEIVKKLESGDLSLDSALELFEEGIKLSRFCHTKLEQAERRVEILLKNSSGQPAAVPFETENDQ
jgi:exodeoxyribonuclease VII small subunit